jgi:hypothetical protein
MHAIALRNSIKRRIASCEKIRPSYSETARIYRAYTGVARAGAKSMGRELRFATI